VISSESTSKYALKTMDIMHCPIRLPQYNVVHPVPVTGLRILLLNVILSAPLLGLANIMLVLSGGLQQTR